MAVTWRARGTIPAAEGLPASDDEYDVVVASGEQVTAGLLAMTLRNMGLSARSTPTPDLEYSPTCFSKKLVLPCRLIVSIHSKGFPRRQPFGLETGPKGAHKGVAGGEVAVDRALAHPRQPGDLGIGGLIQPPILKKAAYGVEDARLGLRFLLASGQACGEGPEWRHDKMTVTKSGAMSRSWDQAANLDSGSRTSGREVRRGAKRVRLQSRSTSSPSSRSATAVQLSTQSPSLM